MVICIRTSNNRGKSKYSCVGYLILFNKVIKCALSSVVSKFHSWYVERCGMKLRGFANNLFKRNVNDFRILVNKPPDQPCTSNTINFRSLTGDPLHLSFL